MNLNIISYILFLPAMMLIAVSTARTCHRHGRVWLMDLFQRDAALVDAISNVLLTCCYVLNLGYVALVITTWDELTGPAHMIALLVDRIALILLSLAAIHFTNIGVLLLWSRIKTQRSTNTSLP